MGQAVVTGIGSVASRAASAAHFTWSNITKFSSWVAHLTGIDTSRATTNVSWLSQVIVRLDLYLDSDLSTPSAVGSGFFLNIPGTTKDVIVTAGHNLIRPPKQGQSTPERVQKIDVRVKGADGKWSTQSVTHTQCFIAEPYEKSPTAANAIYDYGVILLDRAKADETRDALGFNIVLASMDPSSQSLGPGDVGLVSSVGGYPAVSNSEDGDPELETANGRFAQHAERQVHYTAASNQGMSGGPIWVNFGGETVVVGIHNYHGDKPGESNKGTRLEINTIQDILKWSQGTNVLMSKAIKLNPDKLKGDLAFPEGVFMHMGPEENSSNDATSPCYVFSGPKRDYELTKFNIILAQAFTNSSRQRGAQGSAPKTFQYVISPAMPKKERRFLEFNTDSCAAPDQVYAVKNLNVACLVKFQQPPAKRPLGAFDPAGPSFKIIVAQNHEAEDKSKSSEWRLLMSPHDIPPPDDPFKQERVRPGLLLRRVKVRSTQYEEFLLTN